MAGWGRTGGSSGGSTRGGVSLAAREPEVVGHAGEEEGGAGGAEEGDWGAG